MKKLICGLLVVLSLLVLAVIFTPSAPVDAHTYRRTPTPTQARPVPPTPYVTEVRPSYPTCLYRYYCITLKGE